MVKICEVVDGCEDCPKYGDDCDGDKMTEHTDYISRADAIDCCECHGSQECKDRIKALPSADAVSREFYEDAVKANIRILMENRELKEQIESAEAEWIPCSERLPKENEYVGDVCKYYLIQDEYGDMHVAHLSSRGWETIESVKALGCDVVAWMPLPKPYKGGDE